MADSAVRAFGYVLGLALASVACGDGLTAPTPCTNDVQLAVTPGTTPTFTWSPRCTVATLAVHTPPRPSGFLVYWRVRADRSAIEPGVRYGNVPTGAMEEVAPTPLPPGEPTTIDVHDDGGRLLGSLSFVP